MVLKRFGLTLFSIAGLLGQVPAARLDAVRVVYRIAKNKGIEEYRVLVREKLPRFMAKEEFPNGAVTELVAMEPSVQTFS